MRMLTVLATLALAHASTQVPASPPPLLQPVRDLPLPGRATRWDYMSLDPINGKLVLAHLGDNTVVVVSTRAKAPVATISNVRQVHGVLAVPELGRIYATATGTNELVVIDESSLAILARVPVDRYPDGLAYAPGAGKVYVSDKEGRTASVVDVRTNKRVATIELGGTVGNTQYDPVSKHIFINVEGTRELVEVDPATDRILGRTHLPNAEGNHGLLIEPDRRLAFIACEGNDKLLVLDLRDKRVKAEFTVEGEPDVLAYDSVAGILYVATESGPVHLFSTGPDGVTKLGSTPGWAECAHPCGQSGDPRGVLSCESAATGVAGDAAARAASFAIRTAFPRSGNPAVRPARLYFTAEDIVPYREIRRASL